MQIEEMSVDVMVRRDDESARALAATISAEVIVLNFILWLVYSKKDKFKNR